MSWSPTAWLVALPLEYSYNPVTAFPPDIQAIVVLAGKVYPSNDFRPYPIAGEDTYQRCRYAAWIYKEKLGRPVLACGGGSREEPFALLMRHILASEGVPADQIWVDTQSQSTHENAVFGARILRKQGVSRIALVVETLYMARASACFSKEGITVFPVPIENGTSYFASGDFLPNWQAIESNGNTLHEALGLLWYEVHGWI